MDKTYLSIVLIFILSLLVNFALGPWAIITLFSIFGVTLTYIQGVAVTVLIRILSEII